MSLTIFDAIIFCIIAFSGILALMRGLTREILSVVPWVAAITSSLLWISSDVFKDPRNSLAQWLSGYVDEQLSLVIGAILVFLIALGVVFGFIIKLSNSILNSRIGALDRTLGMMFGLSRGFVFVLIGVLLFSELFSNVTKNRWVTQSQSYDFLVRSADLSVKYLAQYINNISPEEKAYILPENNENGTLILPEKKKSENLLKEENDPDFGDASPKKTISTKKDNLNSSLNTINQNTLYPKSKNKSINNKNDPNIAILPSIDKNKPNELKSFSLQSDIRKQIYLLDEKNN